jgi:hypothetical protein
LSKSASVLRDSAEHGTARECERLRRYKLKLLYDLTADGRCPRFSEDREAFGPIDDGWTEVEEEQLVFFGVDVAAAEGDEAGIFRGGEFAEKKAELDVFAVVFEEVEEASAAFVVGHVVRAQEQAAGGGQRTTGHGQ